MKLGALILLALIGLGSTPGSALAQSGAWQCPGDFAGQELVVWNWDTYVAANTIADFEDACDVTVDYNIMTSNEELARAIRDGEPIDVAVISDYMVGLLLQDGQLLPFDLRIVDSLSNIAPEFRQPAYDPTMAQSIPYLYGSMAVAYNRDIVPAVTSWNDVWSYNGPVAWVDDQSLMMSIALRQLGYDPNSIDEAEIDAARDFLLSHAGNVIGVAEDDGQALLAAGYADIVLESSGDVLQLITECNCDTYAFTVPEEGGQLFVDNAVIPITAANPDLAQAFIDYLLEPQVAADIANEMEYATANQAAIDAGLIDERLLSDPLVYPTEETRQRMFITSRTARSLGLMQRAWQEVLDQVG